MQCRWWNFACGTVSLLSNGISQMREQKHTDTPLQNRMWHCHRFQFLKSCLLFKSPCSVVYSSRTVREEHTENHLWAKSLCALLHSLKHLISEKMQWVLNLCHRRITRKLTNAAIITGFVSLKSDTCKLFQTDILLQQLLTGMCCKEGFIYVV